MILVTGGTGFLGRNLVESLISAGEKVRVITRRRLSDGRIDFVQGDVSEPEVVGRAMKGVNVVFHLAANSDHFAPHEEHYKTTVMGTKNVLDAAAKYGVKKVIHMSSAAVTTRNTTNYTRAKSDAEAIAMSYWDKLDVPILRASLIYDETTLAKLRRLSYLPFPYKKQRIHLSYKHSVIQALLGAMIRGKSDVYTVADRSPIFLTDLYRALASPRPMLWIPPQIIWLGVAAAYPVKWSAQVLRARPFVTPEFIRYVFENRSFDTSKAVKELRYSPVDTLDVVRKFKEVE